jgi:CubicO group peptidase (beta-lactamase class C family)
MRILLTLVLTPALAGAQSIPEQLEFVAGAHHAGGFSGSVLVAESGEVVYAAGFGEANLDWNIQNAVDTRHRLGSVTKGFTAALVLDLVEDGLVELEAPITRYLPDYRADTGDRVTVHHLLRHTSGIPNYTAFPDFFEEHGHERWETLAFVAEFCSGDLEFEPGSEFAYSNSGYHMLGAIVESVTGKSYDEALQTRVLEPLGLADTGYDWHDRPIERRATGYVRKAGGELVESDYLDMSLPFAAGALYSTVEDLWRWDRALAGDALLGEEVRALLFTPGLDDYAYGWGVHDPDHADGPLHQHGGGIHGFSSMIARRPGAGRLAVSLSNIQNSVDPAPSLLAVLEGDPYGFPVATEAAWAFGCLPRAKREAAQLGFAEGPVAGDGGSFLFSDLENRRVLRLARDGALTTVVEESGGINGLAAAPDGRVLACRGEEGDLIAFDPESGAVEILADVYDGRPFNKPNDLCLDGDGGVWFSDPVFPGGPAGQELEAVYHLAPDGVVTRTRAAFEPGRRPNGVALSPDGATLYLASSGSDELLAYPVLGPGQLGEPELLAEIPGGGDGLAVDAEGTVFVAAPRERAILAVKPEGGVRGRLQLPEAPANCAFGGIGRRTLCITARTGVYTVRMRTPGPR